MVIRLWLDRREHHIWPEPGGRLDQPLALLVQMDALELLDNTYQFKNSPGADWSKLTKLQTDLIAWLEKDHG